MIEWIAQGDEGASARFTDVIEGFVWPAYEGTGWALQVGDYVVDEGNADSIAKAKAATESALLAFHISVGEAARKVKDQ